MDDDLKELEFNTCIRNFSPTAWDYAGSFIIDSVSTELGELDFIPVKWWQLCKRWRNHRIRRYIIKQLREMAKDDTT